MKRPKERKDQKVDGATGSYSLEDMEWVNQAKNGDSKAYGNLVRKYQDRVFNTCWRICGHLDDARDLTQDAFIKAFERLTSFEHRSSFYTWLFRIAVNLAISHRRSSDRRRVVSMDAPTLADGSQAESLTRRTRERSEGDPAIRTSNAELLSHVARALSALDDEQRAVVVLRDIEGLDYAAIAQILDVAEGTVKSRLHRGRLAIQRALSGLLDETPRRSGSE